MAESSTSFKKGHNIRKPVGAVARTTKQAKEILVSAISGQVEHIEATLNQIREEDKVEYMKLLTKLLDFIVPKKIDMTTDGDKINTPSIDYSKLSENALREIAGLESNSSESGVKP